MIKPIADWNTWRHTRGHTLVRSRINVNLLTVLKPSVMLPTVQNIRIERTRIRFIFFSQLKATSFCFRFLQLTSWNGNYGEICNVLCDHLSCEYQKLVLCVVLVRPPIPSSPPSLPVIWKISLCDPVEYKNFYCRWPLLLHSQKVVFCQNFSHEIYEFFCSILSMLCVLLSNWTFCQIFAYCVWCCSDIGRGGGGKAGETACLRVL